MSSDHSKTTTLLLVENDPGIIDRINEAIPATGAVRFQVEAVPRLADAIIRLKSGPVDLVLLDLNITDSKGIQTFHAIYGEAPEIPIIVLAVNADQMLAETAVKDGAQDFIVKSDISAPVLLRSVRYSIECKRARNAERKQYALLNTLLNSSNDTIIFSVDKDYRYIVFNEKHRVEMLKVWKTDIQIGMNLLEVMTDSELRKKARRSIDRVLSGEVYTEMQFQPDAAIYYEFNWGPINQDGKIVGASVIIRDVTKRKQAEDEIISLAKFLSENPNPVLRISAQGDLLYINEAGLKLLPEWNLEVKKTVHPILQKTVSEAIEKNSSQTLEIPYGFQSYSFSVNPIADAGYANLYGLGITEYKQTEERMTLLNNELTQKNIELEQLVYVASHDLRSPLVNVQGFTRETKLLTDEIAEIVASADWPDEQKARLAEIIDTEFPEAQQFILTSIAKMDILLKGLLKLSRVGRASLSMVKIDMNDIIAKVLKSIEYQTLQCGATVVTTDLPSCLGDPDLINQVFSNLIENAIDYRNTDRVCAINISGTIVNNVAEYIVEDNGIGIAVEHQEKVFEIFHRLNPQESEGEGLGLAIVKKAVTKMAGTIKLESAPEKGCRFTVLLPAG